MLKSLRSLRVGGVILGLFFGVLLATAIPAKAGIIRGTDYIPGMERLLHFTYNSNNDGRHWDWGPGGDIGWNPTPPPPSSDRMVFWLGDQSLRITAPDPHFLGYAALFAGQNLDFLDSMTITADGTTTYWNEIGGTGNFLFHLESLIGDGPWELRFDFEHDGDLQFEFSLYGMTQPIPEPATLAVLGLGLVGLGLARQRMKK